MTLDAAAQPAAHPQFKPARRLSARDLFTVAIFVVIYNVVAMVIAMIGIVSPLMLLVTFPLSAIAAGIPYLLFLTKVRSVGMITLFGAATAVFFLLMGHPWISTLCTLVCALLAETIFWIGQRRRWAAVAAYTLFTVWVFGPLLPLLINRHKYLSSAGIQVLGEAYLAEFDRLMTPGLIAAFFAATVVSGLLGGLLGTSVLRKHFMRAGLA